MPNPLWGILGRARHVYLIPNITQCNLTQSDEQANEPAPLLFFIFLKISVSAQEGTLCDGAKI